MCWGHGPKCHAGDEYSPSPLGEEGRMKDREEEEREEEEKEEREEEEKEEKEEEEKGGERR